MSGSARFHKRQTDCAVHRVYQELASDPLALETFQELLYCARTRAARLFEAPVVNGRHLGVDALVHLSRSKHAHMRLAADWAGTTASWQPAVTSLASHLICQYDVPAFLTSSWYASDTHADTKRGWFVAYSRGMSFRSLCLPMVMTRKMEDIFLTSKNHLPVEHAMRRAELLALGASAQIVDAVLATPLATNLRHSAFWRTFWIFLIANANVVDPAQIGPMIDYIDTIRHQSVTVETLNGRMEVGPPQPTFSMKGRTVQSMLRLMQDWHRSLRIGGPVCYWNRSPFAPLVLEDANQEDPETPRYWQIVELTDSAQLRKEGSALHHCVASYAWRCRSGISSIWSLRLWRGEKFRHVLTIEVNLSKRAVVQARGLNNRNACGKPRQLLESWALRERLRIAV